MIFRSVILSSLVVGPLLAYDLVPVQNRLDRVQEEINSMSKSYAERAMQGRLGQARLRFNDRNYSDALVLLAPLLDSKNPEILALSGHCEFELGNYWAAAEHFKMLSDPTSLYRMVQIEDHFNNLPELEKYYRQITTPPDFVRYIYARQLLLNNQDVKAIEELEKLGASADYKDKATYIMAVAYARQGQLEKAQELFTSLLTHKNFALVRLAKLSSARLYYEQEKPEKAIELYETLNTPEELAVAKIRAGDLNPDLKASQIQYASAETLISDKRLMTDVLVQQEKSDEARVFLQASQDDPTMLLNTWISNQPEIIKLNKFGERIEKEESLIKEVEAAYSVFETDFMDRFGADSSVLMKLARELTAIRERLVAFSGAELVLNLQKNASSAYILKSVKYELDGQVFSVLASQNIPLGTHKLKVTVTYQLSSGDLPSTLSYKIVSSFSFQADRGDVLNTTLAFNENKVTKRPQLAFTQHVIGTDLPLLDRLKQQDSVLSEQLRRVQSEEPQKIRAALLKDKTALDALRIELASLKENYAAIEKQVTQDLKPIWLTQVDERKHETDQASVRIGASERLKLQKRIAQLEQVKAIELKQAEEVLRP